MAYSLPLRVLVKGPSTVNWISWMGGPRGDMAFPRVVEDELLAEGRPVVVRNTAILGQPMREWFPTWEEDLLQFSPDVLLLSPCHYEAVHLFLPHWFERHANLYMTRGGRARRAYRRLALRPLWKLLVSLQGWFDSRLPVGVRRGRMRRAVADVEAYVKTAQQIGSPLVLIQEIMPPASRQSSWFPGMAARVEATNVLLREMVDRLGLPTVRMFSTSDVLHAAGGTDLQVLTPDGFHYTPALHREIGRALAVEIMAWADTQSHLKPR